jgi:hypothetical protein
VQSARRMATLAWSVSIEAARPNGAARVPMHRTKQLTRRFELCLESAEQVSDAFAMVEPDLIGAQFALSYDDPTKAATKALDHFREAAAKSNLPEWPVVVVEVLAEAPQLRPVVGSSEAAEMLSISRQRLAQLAQRPDFPAPWATVAATPVWLRTQIRRFERYWPRRNGRPPKEAAIASASDR